MYVSDVPDGTWPKGVDARATQALAGPPSESSSSSSFEDMVDETPRRQQLLRGKQLARAELVKKKKKPNTLPPCKRGGISIREPSARQQVIADWSNDDEDVGETLQQRAARMTTPTPTARAFDRLPMA